jgi:hypothetical protein
MSSDPKDTLLTDPAPFDRPRFQRTASLAFWGTVIGTLIAAVLVNNGTNNPDNDMRGLVTVLAYLASGLIQGIVVLYFAYKSGNSLWWLLMPFAFFPVINWVAFVVVVGYDPALERSEKSAISLLLWLVACGLPVGFAFVLWLIRPDYVSLLIVGPPQGANIPGIGIPCGWPILSAIVILVSMHIYSFLVGIEWTRLSRGPHVALWVLGIIIFVFTSIFLIRMGPAAILVFKRFYGAP